ncbi:hypothetical protein Asp14428_48520 [Actinoplanes sp. NBRC 14428]|nr:hypothetical protein Asp14428_48520 [Actinoplanes sp. NBRC 14428]
MAASGKKPETTKATPKKKATKKAAGDVFSGTREVWVLPVNSEGTLGVSSSRKVELSDAFDDRTLFVLTKVQGERYWIRTARVRAGGEALCLQVEKDSRVTAAACDAAKSTQLFLFRNTGTSNGKLKYTIRTNNNVYIIVTPEGGVRAVPIGEGTPDIDTPFLLPDRGEAHLPDLD